MRSRRFAPVLAGALVLLGACAGEPAPRSSSLVSVGRVDVTGSSTTAAATTPTTPAAAVALPASASSTGATGVPSSTTSAPAAAASSAPATVAATAPAAPPATTAGSTAPTLTARVAAMYQSIGYPLNDAEAACLTSATDPAALAEIEAKGDAGISGTVAGNLVQALARCEPERFLEEQDQITIEDYNVAPGEARCVTKALNAAAVADATVALAYFEGTTTLSPALQQQLIDKLTPCVGADKAREIVTT